MKFAAASGASLPSTLTTIVPFAVAIVTVAVLSAAIGVGPLEGQPGRPPAPVGAGVAAVEPAVQPAIARQTAAARESGRAESLRAFMPPPRGPPGRGWRPTGAA